MTVERNVDWGGDGPVPDDLVVAGSDADAAALLGDGPPYPAVGLLGGDLARTLGGRGGTAERLRAEGVVVVVDVGVVSLDGGPPLRFLAHCVARRGWWRGPLLAVMNAQYLEAWDVAPRGHPGDGRLDVVAVDPGFGVGDRWKARSRLPAGTHVPHPLIAQRRIAGDLVELERPTPVRLDGVPVGPATTLHLTLEPDALTVVV